MNTLVEGTARHPTGALRWTAGPTESRDEMVLVTTGTVRLHGHLTVPEDAAGIVVFAHDVGGNRHSPRDRFVADVLYGAGLGALLVDLVTPAEEFFRANVVDVALLASRLREVTEWLRHHPPVADAPLCYLGTGAGAAAALLTAAEPDCDVAAVVSRGGLPHLAGHALRWVIAPTLLIVGGRDTAVLDFNRQALRVLGGESRLMVIPGAGHRFEEPGALREVATATCGWFTRVLAAPTALVPGHRP